MVGNMLRILGKIWQWIGAGSFLAILLFISIKVPYERFYEIPTFWEETDLTDGPHVFLLNPSLIKIISFQGDRQQRRFQLSEQLVGVQEGQRILSAEGINLEGSPPSGTRPSSFQAERIAVIGDIHGKYRHLLQLLQNNRIVDNHGNWTWGDNHLVLLGDIFDKGPDVTKCLWLIRKLEAQAEKGNGKVHCLLGNHDYLALNGKSKTAHSKYQLIAEQLGLAQDLLFGKNTLLGQWVRNRKLIVKINDRLFLHAGISSQLLSRKLSLEMLNHLAEQSFSPDRFLELSSTDRALAEEIWGRNGLVWFQGYYDSSFPFGFLGRMRRDLKEAEGVEFLLDDTLRQYGCRQIVVGHTTVKRIRTFYHDKLIVTCLDLPYNDVPSTDLQGELLLIEKDKTYRAGEDGKKAKVIG